MMNTNGVQQSTTRRHNFFGVSRMAFSPYILASSDDKPL